MVKSDNFMSFQYSPCRNPKSRSLHLGSENPFCNPGDQVKLKISFIQIRLFYLTCLKLTKNIIIRAYVGSNLKYFLNAGVTGPDKLEQW